jgi:hypothetical protein
MEHNKDNDNDDLLNEYLSNSQDQTDFDSVLKEKIIGWTASTETEAVLIERHVANEETPTPIIKTQQDILESNVENAEDDLENSSSLRATPEVEVSSESFDAQDVEETGSEASSEAKNKRKLFERPIVEHIPPVSDPEFSRQIIEGKIPQVKVRGIQQGPWAKPDQVAQALPHEEVLDKLGFPTYATIWRNAKSFSVNKLKNDPEQIIKHINRLQGVIFFSRTMVDALGEALAEVLKDYSESQRKHYIEEYSKIYREKSDRAHPGRSKKSTGNGEVKEAKVKKLAKGVRDGLDQMIDGLKASYETMVEMVKNQPDAFLKLEYLKEKFGKVDSSRVDGSRGDKA